MNKAEKIVEALLALDSASYALKIVTTLPNAALPKVFLTDKRIGPDVIARLKVNCRDELERRIAALVEIENEPEEIPS